jgi:hypothetical protein
MAQVSAHACDCSDLEHSGKYWASSTKKVARADHCPVHNSLRLFQFQHRKKDSAAGKKKMERSAED